MKFKRLYAFFLVILTVFSVTNILKVSAIYILNVVVVGDKGVGKTSLIEDFCTYGKVLIKNENFVQLKYAYTKEDKEFIIRFFEINESLDELEKLAAGSTTDKLLWSANAALIVFDLSEGETLKKGRIQRYEKVVKTKSPQSIAVFVPNKDDLLSIEKRNEYGMPIAFYAVNSALEKKYGCRYQDIFYFPISAKNNTGVKMLIDDGICYNDFIYNRDFGPTCQQSLSDPSSSSSSTYATNNESLNKELLKRKLIEKNKEIQLEILDIKNAKEDIRCLKDEVMEILDIKNAKKEIRRAEDKLKPFEENLKRQQINFRNMLYNVHLDPEELNGKKKKKFWIESSSGNIYFG